MIPVFENMPSLGWKQKFSGKEHTSLSRKLASSVLITPEGTSNVIPFLLLPFPLHPLLGHFVCVSVSHHVLLGIMNFQLSQETLRPHLRSCSFFYPLREPTSEFVKIVKA